MIYQTEFRHQDEAEAKAKLYSTVRNKTYYVWKRTGKLEQGERRYHINRFSTPTPCRVLITSFRQGEEQE